MSKGKGLTKTNIEWADYTWPITSGCKNGCLYCYAMIFLRRLGSMGIDRYAKCGTTPTYHRDQRAMLDNTKKPGVVFLSSMGDVLYPKDFRVYDKGEFKDGDFIASDGVCSEIAEAMKAHSQHDYVVLTKHDLLYDYTVRRNAKALGAFATVGTSITLSTDYAGSEQRRLEGLLSLEVPYKVLSIEPFDPDYCSVTLETVLMLAAHVQAEIASGQKKGLWVIVGGLTGTGRGAWERKMNSHAIAAIDYLVRQVSECYYHPVFIKNNFVTKKVIDSPSKNLVLGHQWRPSWFKTEQAKVLKLRAEGKVK
jgi:protein gp37